MHYCTESRDISYLSNKDLQVECINTCALLLSHHTNEVASIT